MQPLPATPAEQYDTQRAIMAFRETAPTVQSPSKDQVIITPSKSFNAPNLNPSPQHPLKSNNKAAVRDRSFYIASMHALLETVPRPSTTDSSPSKTAASPECERNCAGYRTSHSSAVSKAKRITEAFAALPIPLVAGGQRPSSNQLESSSVTTSPEKLPRVVSRSSSNSSTGKPKEDTNTLPDRYATPVLFDPVSQAPLSTPNIARVFKAKSAHLTSPMFHRLPPASEPSRSSSTAYFPACVRANPTAKKAHEDALIPVGIEPDVITTAVFDGTVGFGKDFIIDMGYRARRVPLPYAIRIVYDGRGSVVPQTAKLEIDSKERGGLLLNIIHDTGYFEEIEVEGRDGDIEILCEAVVLFWAAPDTFDGESNGKLILSVTDAEGNIDETTIELRCKATEPSLSVQLPTRTQVRKGQDIQITFPELQDFGTENIVVRNETEHEAPLLFNIMIAESGRGVFSIGRNWEEQAHCIPVSLRSGESFVFQVNYDASCATQGLRKYFGTILLKLASMYFPGLPHKKDGDLHFAYDQVIALQANRSEEYANDTINFREDTGVDDSLHQEPLHEMNEAERECVQAMNDATTPEHGQNTATETAEMQPNVSTVNIPSLAPLDVVLSPIGLDPVGGDEDSDEGPLYEGLFNLLQPVEWLECPGAGDDDSNALESNQLPLPSQNSEPVLIEQEEQPVISESGNESSAQNALSERRSEDGNGVAKNRGELTSMGDKTVRRDRRDEEHDLGISEDHTGTTPQHDSPPSRSPPQPRLPGKTPYGKLIGYSPGGQARRQFSLHSEIVPQPNFYDNSEIEVAKPAVNLESKAWIDRSGKETETKPELMQSANNETSEAAVTSSGKDPPKETATNSDCGGVTSSRLPKITCDVVEEGFAANSANLFKPARSQEMPLEPNFVHKCNESESCVQLAGGNLMYELSDVHIIDEDDSARRQAGSETVLQNEQSGSQEHGFSGTANTREASHTEAKKVPPNANASMRKNVISGSGAALRSNVSSPKKRMDSNLIRTSRSDVPVGLVCKEAEVVAPTRQKPPVPPPLPKSVLSPNESTMIRSESTQMHPTSQRIYDSLSSTSTMPSGASTPVLSGMVSRSLLKRALGRDDKPKLRMPRSIRKNGVVLAARTESVVLPLGNGSSSEIEVNVKIKKIPGCEAAVSLSSDFCVIGPGGRVDIAITRCSSGGGRLGIVLSCSFLKGVSAPTSYQVPFTVEAAPTIPPLQGFTIDRPTLTFYNPGRRISRQCRVRVHNGTRKSAPYRIWIGSRDQFVDQSDSNSVFRLATPSKGFLEPQASLDIDVTFDAWQRVEHFYASLNIKIGGQTQTVPMFGYTSGSNIKLEMTEKGYLYARNDGLRHGFLVLTQPNHGGWDNLAMKVVLGPDEDDMFELPHGSGTVIYTGDEITRERLALALETNAEQHKDRQEELAIFTSTVFEGASKAREEERFDFSKDENATFYYASRLFDAETREYMVDVRSNRVVPAEDIKRDRGGWRASYDGNGWVHIVNSHPDEKLNFHVEGADPSRGSIPALGDAKVAPFLEKIVVRARRSSVELLSPALTDPAQRQ